LPIAVGVDPADPIFFDLTRDQPDNVIEVGVPKSGSAASTLSEAILEHGGEARHSRDAFLRLPDEAKRPDRILEQPRVVEAGVGEVNRVLWAAVFGGVETRRL
jgi:hypothetical protein